MFSYAHIDSISKAGYVITNRLVEFVNSIVEYKVVNTWGYGDMKNKEKLDGMMGHLVRKEVDIAGESFFLDKDFKPSKECK